MSYPREKAVARLLSLVVVIAMLVTVASAWGGQRKKKSAKPKTGGARAAALAVVDRFEKAYQKKDKNTMLLKLMVPTTDAGALEKRYQWLRGYGPTDPPGGRRPPILFETSRGSFVPFSYKVSSVTPAGPTRWNVLVREEGTYADEDGKYRVSRVRLFRLTSYKGSWYVLDYVLQENQEDYGFYVDDVSDRMTPL